MKLLLSCILLAGIASTTSTARAKLVTKPVAYKHDGVDLEGYLAYDDEKATPGKAPGILVVPEWWGLNDFTKNRAEEVAKLGYVAFAVDMYGKGVKTEDPKEAGKLAGQFYGKPLMAARAQAGLDALLATGLADPKKLGAIGFCFGGSTIQALAYSGAPLLGIASFHGGPVNAPKEAFAKIKTKFLLMNGAIDPMVKPDDRAALEKSLEEAKIDYQSIDYAGALHAFTNPNADKIAADKSKGMTGKVGYNPIAAARSWHQMQLFFGEIFGRNEE